VARFFGAAILRGHRRQRRKPDASIRSAAWRPKKEGAARAPSLDHEMADDLIGRGSDTPEYIRVGSSVSAVARIAQSRNDLWSSPDILVGAEGFEPPTLAV
jgi:hypothetical protein